MAAIFDVKIAPVYPPLLLKSLQQSRNASLCLWIVSLFIHQHGDAAHLFSGLLRPRHRRPRRRSAEQHDELAAPLVGGAAKVGGLATCVPIGTRAVVRGMRTTRSPGR